MRAAAWRRPLALVLAVALGACGWKITPPPPRATTAGPRSVAERVVLQVHGSGLPWGSGGLGETVREVLTTSGSFREVYYPIEPRNPPPLRLVVTASGTVDEEIGLGVAKSVIIGLLLFLPVGVIRFNKTYDLTAEVVLLNEGREVKSFRVENATEVSHTMFSTMEDYEPAARKAAFTNLGQQIAWELSTVSIPPSSSTVTRRRSSG